MIKLVRNNVKDRLKRFLSDAKLDVDKNDTILKNNNVQTPKTRKQFLVPVLTQEKLKKLSSVVGLHLAPNGVSWAKLSPEGNVLNKWDVLEFAQLPKRNLPIDILRYVKTVINEIPEGDLYIFELPESSAPLNQKSISLNYNNQQLIFSSMLIALLDARTANSKTDIKHTNSIFYLKSKLSAKLFGILVGTEKVSSLSIISSVFDNSKNSLPCTPVIVDKSFKKHYYDSSSVHKELLGHSLMIAMCFLDLCLYKNSESIAAATKIKR
ncbi:uncharacterized protein LOC112904004 [Agrilus planipennis]|uniref:Uncharacterized protein LOC108737088 n=1 Tax=Agrilus planipennis TaxID=224129 RepID=A0A1W4WMV2_AGRPL|nr:uncharacterized protein LOC108737088 [Agrilus planipennis]XP_025828811.1 uncharacterized protein LOC112904004 [Agrilus planipennis]